MTRHPYTDGLLQPRSLFPAIVLVCPLTAVRRKSVMRLYLI